ncbi:Cholesterol 7-desaturase [Varanus komodoensis]|nr:Cholesterol 7-desaturase [Varanus komodoensis]
MSSTVTSSDLRPEAWSGRIGGEQFAVFRGSDGDVHVLEAYCPHLGANLAVGGRVQGGCLECPFHGWQFRGEDGKCVRIPYAEKLPEFAKVRVWPSREVGGMIVVWYHCDGIGPTWQVPEQEEIVSRAWVFRGITEHFVSAHIEEIPENAADVAHLSFLHGPSILSGVDLRYTNSPLWAFFKHHWQAEWHPEPQPNAHCSCMRVQHSVTVCGRRFSLLDLTVSARQVGPGLVFLLFTHPFLGRGVLIHSVTPLEPLLQHVVHRMYYQQNIPALIPKFILWAERVQFERDIMIWNNKQYLSKPLLVKEDAAIQRHRRWYSQFYSKNSARLASQEDSLDCQAQHLTGAPAGRAGGHSEKPLLRGLSSHMECGVRTWSLPLGHHTQQARLPAPADLRASAPGTPYPSYLLPPPQEGCSRDGFS